MSTATNVDAGIPTAITRWQHNYYLNRTYIIINKYSTIYYQHQLRQEPQQE